MKDASVAELIQSLATEAKKHQCTVLQPYVNPNIFRIPTLGSRDPLVSAYGWNVELGFVCPQGSDCIGFTKYVTQEFEKAYAAKQVGDVRFFNPTEKSLQISCLWIDQ